MKSFKEKLEPSFKEKLEALVQSAKSAGLHEIGVYHPCAFSIDFQNYIVMELIGGNASLVFSEQKGDKTLTIDGVRFIFLKESVEAVEEYLAE